LVFLKYKSGLLHGHKMKKNKNLCIKLVSC